MIHYSNKYYSIGSSHISCEDYAISGLSDNNKAYALISDGCSSSKNTDFGSRIISKCTENIIKYNLPDEYLFRNKLLLDINLNNSNLELNKNCLDATLIFINSELLEYKIYAYGDGGILKLKHNGEIEFTYIEYTSGAPLYLNYYLDGSRFDNYKKQYGFQRKITKYLITPTEFSISLYYDNTGEPHIECGQNDYKVISVVSDGIISFNKNSQPADIIEIVRQIMDFKSIKGEFIQRRMNGFKLYCEKNNLKHTDDFSMAGISFEKNIL